MKRAFALVIGLLFLFLVGCGTPHNESSVEAIVQSTANEDIKATTSRDSIDGMLTESYPWRRAYAEFLWDRDAVLYRIQQLFCDITGNADSYDCFIPFLSSIYLDADDILELLVYFQNDAPPGPEYFGIYHYNSDQEESCGSIIEFCKGTVGGGCATWKYLPHGGAFYTNSYSIMSGFNYYHLFMLDRGEWISLDELPDIMRKNTADKYGVYELNESDSEPMFSSDWCYPEPWDTEYMLKSYQTCHYTVQDLFGEDAVEDLPSGTE